MKSWVMVSAVLLGACGVGSVDHVSIDGADPSADVQVASMDAALRYLDQSDALTISVDGGRQQVSAPLVLSHGQSLQLDIRPTRSQPSLILDFGDNDTGIVLHERARLHATRDMLLRQAPQQWGLLLDVGSYAEVRVWGDLNVDPISEAIVRRHGVVDVTGEYAAGATEVQGTLDALHIVAGDHLQVGLAIDYGGEVRTRTLHVENSGSQGIRVDGPGSQLIVGEDATVASNESGLEVANGASMTVGGTLELIGTHEDGAVASRASTLRAHTLHCSNNGRHDLVARHGSRIDAQHNTGCARIRMEDREDGTVIRAD